MTSLAFLAFLAFLAVEAPADTFEMLHAKGEAALGEKKFVEAEQVFREARRIAPNKIQVVIGLGVALKSQQKFDEALQIFEEADRRWPATREIRWHLATLYAWTKRFSEADRTYREMVKADPKDAEAFIGLGTLAGWQERHDEAIEYFRQALKAFPNAADAYVGLGRVHSWRKEFAKSEEAYLKALRLLPDHEEAQQGLLKTYQWSGEWAKAIALAERWRQRSPQDAEGWVMLGKLYRSAKRLPEAIKAFEEAKRLDLQRSDVSAELGLLYSQTQQRDAAVNELRRALELDRGNVETSMALARVYSWSDRLDEAIEQYEKVVEDHPQDADAASALARVYAWKGHWRESHLWYEYALKVSPNHEESREGLRWLRRLAAPEWSVRAEAFRAIERDSSGTVLDIQTQQVVAGLRLKWGSDQQLYLRGQSSYVTEMDSGLGVENFRAPVHDVSGEWTQGMGGGTSVIGRGFVRYLPSFSGLVFSRTSSAIFFGGSMAAREVWGPFSASVAVVAEPVPVKSIGTELDVFYQSSIGAYGSWKINDRWNLFGVLERIQTAPNLFWWKLAYTARWAVEGWSGVWIEATPSYRTTYEDVGGDFAVEWQWVWWGETVMTARSGVSATSPGWMVGYRASVQIGGPVWEDVEMSVHSRGYVDGRRNESWDFTLWFTQRL